MREKRVSLCYITSGITQTRLPYHSGAACLYPFFVSFPSVYSHLYNLQSLQHISHILGMLHFFQKDELSKRVEDDTEFLYPLTHTQSLLYRSLQKIIG